MNADFLSPAGRVGRRAYAIPILSFFAVALFSAFATGPQLSASSIANALDNPWSAMGRAWDASILSGLPQVVSAPLVFGICIAAVWAVFVLTIKRLRDLGNSGWWSLLLLTPGLGLLLMLVCAVTPGQTAEG